MNWWVILFPTQRSNQWCQLSKYISSWWPLLLIKFPFFCSFCWIISWKSSEEKLKNQPMYKIHKTFSSSILSLVSCLSYQSQLSYSTRLNQHAFTEANEGQISHTIGFLYQLGINDPNSNKGQLTQFSVSSCRASSSWLYGSNHCF